MGSRNVGEKISSLFPANAVEGFMVNDKESPISLTIRFANGDLYATARKNFISYLHPTKAAGNNTLSLVISPEFKAKLEDPYQFNQLKNQIATTYQSIINSSPEEKESIDEFESVIEPEKDPLILDTSSNLLIQATLNDLIKSTGLGPEFKFEFNEGTKSTPYQNFRLELDATMNDSADKIKKIFALNGIEAEIKYHNKHHINFPLIVVNQNQAQSYHFYQRGIELAKSGKFSEAALDYDRAIKAGSIKAKTNLAILYLQNKVPPANSQKKLLAFELLKEAAGSGHERAQFNLGKMYEHGDGIPSDLVEARRWYTTAAENGNKEAKELVEDLNKKLSDFDKIINIFSRNDLQVSHMNKDNTISLHFKTDEAFQRALQIFSADIHPTNAFGNNNLTIVLSDKLRQKLSSVDEYNHMKQQVIKPESASDQQEKPLEVLSATQPPKHYLQRAKKFLTEDNVKIIEKFLASEGLRVGEKKNDVISDQPFQTVFDKENNPKFNIHTDKLTTQDYNFNTFIAMLKSFQAVHGEKVFPKITTNNEASKELWKKAYLTVYKDQEKNLEERILFRPKVKPLQSPNPEEKSPKRSP